MHTENGGNIKKLDDDDKKKTAKIYWSRKAGVGRQDQREERQYGRRRCNFMERLASTVGYSAVGVCGRQVMFGWFQRHGGQY